MHIKPQIFISSTSHLETERKQLANALKTIYAPYIYEEDRARKRSPKDHCLEVIMESEVFVGIVGDKYGSSFEDSSDSKSICEWEYDIAKKRSDMEIMMLLTQPDKSSSSDPAQQRFREKLTDFKEGTWCRFFSSTKELVNLVETSLNLWLAEFYTASKQKQNDRSRWLAGLVLPVCATIVCAYCALAAVNVVYYLLPPSKLISLGAVTFSIVLLTFILWLADSRRSS
ncbi:MAG: DUF4062 domain-containing protein [Desulfuromusa sp.]|nr:DUF4062 domain-containing protein [Desulfuromusa sp.]